THGTRLKCSKGCCPSDAHTSRAGHQKNPRRHSGRTSRRGSAGSPSTTTSCARPKTSAWQGSFSGCSTEAAIRPRRHPSVMTEELVHRVPPASAAPGRAAEVGEVGGASRQAEEQGVWAPERRALAFG